MDMNAPLETIIKFALFLIVAFVVIFVVSQGYDSVDVFLNIFSLAERCQEHTARDFEQLIKGYAQKSELIEQFQLCERYRRCPEFQERFALFEQKNREDGEALCGVEA